MGYACPTTTFAAVAMETLITCTYFYGWTVTAAAVSILGCNAESVPLPTQQISQSVGRVRGDVG